MTLGILDQTSCLMITESDGRMPPIAPPLPLLATLWVFDGLPSKKHPLPFQWVVPLTNYNPKPKHPHILE